MHPSVKGAPHDIMPAFGKKLAFHENDERKQFIN
jgi:hypothetical protein